MESCLIPPQELCGVPVHSRGKQDADEPEGPERPTDALLLDIFLVNSEATREQGLVLA